jgi:hypothetical protein
MSGIGCSLSGDYCFFVKVQKKRKIVNVVCFWHSRQARVSHIYDSQWNGLCYAAGKQRE